MHGVAAEVAQEVVVFFQHSNFDPGAGQQQSVNQARGTATGNTDLGSQNSRHDPTLLAGSFQQLLTGWSAGGGNVAVGAQLL